MLDKDTQDILSQALIHLVRNCVDHGIETPEDRMAKGKDGMGVIEMQARRDKGSLVVVLKDDGQGIDTALIRKKANLPDVTSDEDALAFIFRSGFSTKEQATTTSGRGVGMDAVKKTVEDSLHGTIKVHTEMNGGTEFIITIPHAA
jgi:two-component system chemotaxis sensor kinase CheA